MCLSLFLFVTVPVSMFDTVSVSSTVPGSVFGTVPLYLSLFLSVCFGHHGRGARKGAWLHG